MWIIILIVIVVVFLVCIGGNAPSVSTQYEGLMNEIVEKLKLVQIFSNSKYWEEESGLVMLIPVNSRGVKYASDADRIEISILLYDNDPYRTKLMPPSDDFQSQFRLINNEGSLMYISNTVSTFHCGYKTIMSVINSYVPSQFPNTQFEFDGSRVLTKKLR